METENKKPRNPTIQQGWTLRDEFANSAMQGMISNNRMYDLISMPAIKNLAQESYLIADAMLKQRELDNL